MVRLLLGVPESRPSVGKPVARMDQSEGVPPTTLRIRCATTSA